MIVQSKHPLTFFCTYCGISFVIPSDRVSAQITCPSCQAYISVPPPIHAGTPPPPLEQTWRSPLIHIADTTVTPSKQKSVWRQSLAVACQIAGIGGFFGFIGFFRNDAVYTLFERFVFWCIASWSLYAAFFVIAYPIAVVICAARRRTAEEKRAEIEAPLSPAPKDVLLEKD